MKLLEEEAAVAAAAKQSAQAAAFPAAMVSTGTDLRDAGDTFWNPELDYLHRQPQASPLLSQALIVSSIDPGKKRMSPTIQEDRSPDAGQRSRSLRKNPLAPAK